MSEGKGKYSNLEPLFELEKAAEGVYLCKELNYKSWNRAHIWILPGSERNLVIDTGIGLYNVREFLDSQEVFKGLPFLAVATHMHFDHTGGLKYFDDVAVHEADAEFLEKGDNVAIGSLLASWEIPQKPDPNWRVGMYKVDPIKPTRTLKHGEIIDIGERVFKIIHLPGHTPGSIGVVEESTGYFFSGDTIYQGPQLDFTPHGNWRDYLQTCQILKEMAADVSRVFPGHRDTFEGQKLYEIASNYEKSIQSCCMPVLRCCVGGLISLGLKGRNTTDCAGKCCFYSCCCCCCC